MLLLLTHNVFNDGIGGKVCCDINSLLSRTNDVKLVKSCRLCICLLYISQPNQPVNQSNSQPTNDNMTIHCTQDTQ
jgi:hypothetical protein